MGEPAAHRLPACQGAEARTVKRSAIIAISAASGLALLAGGTAAGAAIAGPVGGDGTIHGCYDVGGNVKVVDASAACP